MSTPVIIRRYASAVVVALLLAMGISYVVMQAASTTVVINEFRTRGPNGEADEFVELRNVSGADIVLTGWQLYGVDAAGNETLLATLDGSHKIKTGCYFLIVSSIADYSGVDFGDKGYDTSYRVPDAGGFRLKNGATIDQVGMSAGSGSYEGSPLAPLVADAAVSYTRVGTTDTDDNPADFQVQAESPTNYDPAGCANGRPIR